MQIQPLMVDLPTVLNTGPHTRGGTGHCRRRFALARIMRFARESFASRGALSAYRSTGYNSLNRQAYYKPPAYSGRRTAPMALTMVIGLCIHIYIRPAAVVLTVWLTPVCDILSWMHTGCSNGMPGCLYKIWLVTHAKSTVQSTCGYDCLGRYRAWKPH